MAVMKRKAVVTTRFAKVLKRNEKKASKSKKAQEEEEVEEQDVEEENAVLRKPASAPEEEEEDEGVEEQEVDEEKLNAQREKETVAARRKELKGTAIDALKELVLSKGLEKGKKEDMIEALVKHEAKARAEVRAQEARVRTVMAGKVAELEALSLPALREQGAVIGLKGQISKQAFVEGLLKQWQEEDGVDKALAKMSRDAREEELAALDKPVLRKLCKKKGVDPFVKEVLVERLVRLEVAAGKFARPRLVEPEKEEPIQAGKTMVDALLASEAARKKEKELKMQREEAAANRLKDLEGMTIEQLKKLAAKKKLEVTGKKTDLVAALSEDGLREDMATARKEHLRSMSAEGLQKLLQQNGLHIKQTGKVEAMVEAFLAHEAKIHEESRAFELVVDEVLAKRKEELDAETAARLKELCESKGVTKIGVSKEERVERYLEHIRQEGEADTAAAVLNRDKRSAALFALDEKALVSLCEEADVDPLVKEVMVDRLLAHENEHGSAKDDEAPPAKKTRKSKE